MDKVLFSSLLIFENTDVRRLIGVDLILRCGPCDDRNTIIKEEKDLHIRDNMEYLSFGQYSE